MKNPQSYTRAMHLEYEAIVVDTPSIQHVYCSQLTCDGFVTPGFEYGDAPELGPSKLFIRLIHMYMNSLQPASECDLDRTSPLPPAAHPCRVRRGCHTTIPPHPLTNRCTSQQCVRLRFDEGSHIFPQPCSVASKEAVAQRMEEA